MIRCWPVPGERSRDLDSLQYGRRILERRCSGLGDGMVLIAGAAAHPDCSHNFATPFKRNPTGKDHDFALVGSVNSEKLSAGLRMCCQILGGNVERA